MHAVERELIKVTGFKPLRKYANRQDYLGSVLNAVLKLSNDEFDDISDDAAAWANAATMAKNAKAEDLPDFTEVDYTADPEADEADPDEDEDEVESADDDEADDEDGEPDEDEESEDEEVDDDEELPLTEDEADDEPEDDEDDEEPEPVKPVKAAKKEAAKKAAKAPAKADKPDPKPAAKPAKGKRPAAFEEDVVLDKWGCMEGSKNAQALALFEKGATAKEVKDKIGGTYYNILGKCVKNGHKVEKEGALIKVTHKDSAKAPKAPAAKKAVKKK